MMKEAPFTVFVVEDDEWYNKLLVHAVSMDPEYMVESFTTGKDLLAALHKAPDVVTLDYRLPDMDGATLLEKVKAVDPNIEVVVISEQQDVGTAMELLRAGVYDYLVKAKDIKDKLLNVLRNIQKNTGLRKQVQALRTEVQGKYSFQNTLIGESAALKKVFPLIEKAMETSLTVTITGETGTGKEVVAKAIHYNSKRKNEPFVAVNVAAIPATLVESEFFGHEKGAFTGANTARKGKFEEAGTGTLFLDEIGELEKTFQVKLLRAVQEREVVRVGGNKPIKTNCRIIIATNRDLAAEVKSGNMREDLYYRFFGLAIHLPPLRERGEDVLLLADYFKNNFCKEDGSTPKPLDQEAKQKLLSYDWPGNVRELKSVVELAQVMATNNTITGDDVSLSTSDALPDLLSTERTMREYMQRIVKICMQKFDDDTSLVAKHLDIGQTTVYRLLKEMKEGSSSN